MRYSLKILFVAIVVLSIVTFLMCNRVENELNESMKLSSAYDEGYLDGTEDYNNGDTFQTSYRSDFDKLLPIYKFAYDSGYMYGWVDASNATTAHEDRGHVYSPLKAPDFMYKIYWFFK